MSFVQPLALLLFLPLALVALLARSRRFGWTGHLPGAWQTLIAAPLRGHAARRSSLGQPKAPLLCIAIASLLVLALARPGIDSDFKGNHANLAGRVLVLDVGPDLSVHRLFLDALHGAGPPPATAVVAVAGDAYRIVPFTTDITQVNRYVSVLARDMMPAPGHRPHLGLAEAERILTEAGFAVRQIVMVSAMRPPDTIVEIPDTGTDRVLVVLDEALVPDWAGSKDGWDARVVSRGSAVDIAQTLRDATRDAARAELPGTWNDASLVVLALGAVFWLLLFRRRAT